MARRKSQERPERKIIYFFTEGETEEKYFNLFKSLPESRGKSTPTIKVITPPNTGLQGERLIHYSNSYISKLKKFEKPDEVYIFFDKDSIEFDEILRCVYNDYGYKIGLCNHSFELWLLCHFKEVYSYKSQKELERELSGALGIPYKKADRNILETIIQNISCAYQNTSQFDQINQTNCRSNPYTNLTHILHDVLR